jgi:Zn finger protein HypA/HybF involved in hydrogenase expression
MNEVMKCNKCDNRWILEKDVEVECPKCHSPNVISLGRITGCPFYSR